VTSTFLAPDLAEFRCDLNGGTTFLSALRLWEHGVLGQVNVTNSPISPRYWASHVARYVDVIQRVEGIETIVCTLQDIVDADATLQKVGDQTESGLFYQCSVFRDRSWQTNPAVLALQRDVGRFLFHLSHRLAERGSSPTFWPMQKDAKPEHSTLGIPGLYSKLIVFLAEKCVGRHKAKVWLAMLESGQRQGFKEDELSASGLITWLSEQHVAKSDRRYTAQDLIKRMDWSGIRLSVMPVVQYSETPITLQLQTDRQNSLGKKLSKVSDSSKPQVGQRRFLHKYDPVLGYRIEGIEHQTIWGREVHWQAVTFRGQPIKNQRGFSLLTKPEVATQLAIHHAHRMMPKKEPKDIWIAYTLPGGKNYREWLVTLPWYPITHEDNHFDLRNVLIHIRCDERQDGAGHKILFLQEVQSDWAQTWAQSQREQGSSSLTTRIPKPPFGKEWPSLAAKLMLLYAVAWNFDGIAWTTGAMQVEQFGKERSWFKTLYDQMLPRSMDQAITPHEGVVAELQLVDDREVRDVMGVMFGKRVKTSLQSKGLPVWG
jgi:hypothetical protein